MKKAIIGIILIVFCIGIGVGIYMFKFNNKDNTELDNVINDPNTENSKFDVSNGINQNAPIIKLNSGYDMPTMGIGTYSLSGETCVNSVYTAIKLGYRKVDTAYMYGNKKSWHRKKLNKEYLIKD